jgi:isomerase DpgB
VTIAAVNRWERALRRLERLDVVNIAVVEGTCGGPALDLLLAADFRIGSPDLRLVLPVNDGHFWPGMSLYRLVQHIGLAKARQIVLWGVDIPVGRASELGLIDQVSDNISDAINTAAVLRGRISDRETGIRRQLLLEATAAEYDEALGAHLASCDRELRRLRDGGTQTDTAQPNTARSSPASTSTGLTNPTRTSPAPTEVAGP